MGGFNGLILPIGLGEAAVQVGGRDGVHFLHDALHGPQGFNADAATAARWTAGQLDEAARYYMGTRGLSPELSRRLLVQAFIGDALVALADDEEAHDRLLRVALDKLDRHL